MTKINDQLTIMPLDDTFSIGEEGQPSARVLRTISGQHVMLTQQLDDYYHRKQSWLAKVFPTELDKVLRDGQLRLARNECELNERILQLACQMKYNACREVAEVWVKGIRVDARQTFFGFVANRLEVLQEQIQNHRQNFAQHMKRRYEQAEGYKAMPEFYAHYMRSIDHEIEGTMSWLDDLLDRFRASVQEGVAQYERPELSK